MVEFLDKLKNYGVEGSKASVYMGSTLLSIFVTLTIVPILFSSWINRLIIAGLVTLIFAFAHFYKTSFDKIKNILCTLLCTDKIFGNDTSVVTTTTTTK